MLAQRIIELNTNDLYDSIQLILRDLRERSENTSKNYESNYNEFFQIILNKDMQFVTWEEFLSITYKDVLQYREVLKQTNINKTINTKIASLTTLYKELYKINRQVDIVTVDLKRLPEDEDEDNSYGSLTHNEVQNLLSYCLSLPDKQKPLIKKLFFETAYITAIRQGALLKLKWKNIEKEIGKNGEEIYVIKVKDKGTIDVTPISNEFYNKLLELQKIMYSDGYKNDPEDRVFNITKKTLAKTLKDYCKKYNIDKDRNIVLHSLKKASIDKVYHETRDINVTARHGHHKTVEMVYKHYEGKNKGLTDRPSYSIFNNNINIQDFDNYSKSEIINAISKCGNSIVNEVLNNLK